MSLIDKAKAMRQPDAIPKWLRGMASDKRKEVDDLCRAYLNGELPPHVTVSSLWREVIAPAGIAASLQSFGDYIRKIRHEKMPDGRPAVKGQADRRNRGKQKPKD
jgi:hypothetical protein